MANIKAISTEIPIHFKQQKVLSLRNLSQCWGMRAHIRYVIMRFDLVFGEANKFQHFMFWPCLMTLLSGMAKCPKFHWRLLQSPAYNTHQNAIRPPSASGFKNLMAAFMAQNQTEAGDGDEIDATRIAAKSALDHYLGLPLCDNTFKFWKDYRWVLLIGKK